MPLNGPSPLSQAVILTIVHRVSAIGLRFALLLSDGSSCSISSAPLSGRMPLKARSSSPPSGGSSARPLYLKPMYVQYFPSPRCEMTADPCVAQDPIIAPYCSRVLPNVQSLLNITKQRLSILPGGAQAIETARAISDIQDILSHKPA